MRPLSIRGRLALWYGAALAVSLAVFAAIGFAFVARSSLASTDASLDEALDAVESALHLEESEKHPPDSYLGPLVQDFRFRDLKVAILDRATGRAYFSLDTSGVAGDSTNLQSPSAALAHAHVPLEAPDMRRMMSQASPTVEQINTISVEGVHVLLQGLAAPEIAHEGLSIQPGAWRSGGSNLHAPPGRDRAWQTAQFHRECCQ